MRDPVQPDHQFQFFHQFKISCFSFEREDLYRKNNLVREREDLYRNYILYFQDFISNENILL